jgi:hypothetical protein
MFCARGWCGVIFEAGRGCTVCCALLLSPSTLCGIASIQPSRGAALSILSQTQASFQCWPALCTPCLSAASCCKAVDLVLGSKGSSLCSSRMTGATKTVSSPIRMQFCRPALILEHTTLWLASVARRGCRFQLSLWGFGGRAQCSSTRRFCPVWFRSRLLDTEAYFHGHCDSASAHSGRMRYFDFRFLFSGTFFALSFFDPLSVSGEQDERRSPAQRSCHGAVNAHLLISCRDCRDSDLRRLAPCCGARL